MNGGDMLTQWFRVVSTPGILSALRALDAPLAGHAGACAKVTQATITGQTDAPCTCGATGAGA